MKSFREKLTHGISPSDRRLLGYVKDNLLPPGFESHENYVPKRKMGHQGFDLGVKRQLGILDELSQDPFPALFAEIRADEEINTGLSDLEFDRTRLVHNGFFPSPDAEFYAAMIARHRPAKLVEVGSGYSTLVARKTVRHLGLDTKIQVIDPEPRRRIEDAADKVQYERVEDSGFGAQDVAPGDLLFIDSSHVCRSGGDLPYLFCEVLPLLPENVLVHVHDIFLPYDYPDNYFERFYTEQYLLHTLLASAPRFEVTLAAHYLVRDHLEAVRKAVSSELGSHAYFYGASFWFRTNSA